MQGSARLTIDRILRNIMSKIASANWRPMKAGGHPGWGAQHWSQATALESLRTAIKAVCRLTSVNAGVLLQSHHHAFLV